MRWVATMFLGAVVCGTLPLGARADAVVNQPPEDSVAPSHFEPVESATAPPAAPVVTFTRPGDSAPATSAGGASSGAPSLDTPRLVLALAIVLVIIFALRWIARRVMGSGAGTSSRAVQVLSRTAIAPRQQVLLLQVGRRVVVVGDSGQQMATLCEITDADEIAALVAQSGATGPDSLTRAFSGLLGRAGNRFRETDPEAEVPALPSDQVALSEDANDPAADPAVSLTRQELSGLMDKVRLVSRQLGRG